MPAPQIWPVANRDVAAAVDIDVGIETVHRDRLDAVVVELAVHDSAAVGLRIPVKIEEIQTGKTVLIAFGIIEPYVLGFDVMPWPIEPPWPRLLRRDTQLRMTPSLAPGSGAPKRTRSNRKPSMRSFRKTVDELGVRIARAKP